MDNQDKLDAPQGPALAETPLGQILDEKKKRGVDPVIHAVVADIRGRLEAAGAHDTQIAAVTDTLLDFWRPTDSQLRQVAQELGIDVARLRHLAGGKAPHLWEIPHPDAGLYGADDELIENLGSFQEVRDWLNTGEYGESTYWSVIYRWDWIDRRADPDHGPAEGQLPEELILTCANTRRGVTFHVTCPISKEQEPEVLEFLRGPRVLGALQQMWAPLLDHLADAPMPGSTTPDDENHSDAMTRHSLLTQAVAAASRRTPAFRPRAAEDSTGENS